MLRRFVVVVKNWKEWGGGLWGRRGRAVVVCLLLIGFVPAGATADREDVEDRREFVFSVRHGPVTTALANLDSNGHQLGDLRVTSLPTQYVSGKPAGRLDATLITTGIDVPEPDDEIRISNLIFVFGVGVDQIVVNGSGFYPAAGGTIDLDSTLIRPVTGGSGHFAATTGWAETQHFADDTWEHTFHLLLPERDDNEEGHRRGRRSR
jgi:hypothetical protein